MSPSAGRVLATSASSWSVTSSPVCPKKALRRVLPIAAQAFTAAYAGRRRLAQDLTERGLAALTAAHASEAVADFLARTALIDALFGNPAAATRVALQVDRSSAGWDAQAHTALALALAREPIEANKIAANVNRRLPESTFVQYYYLPANSRRAGARSREAG